MSSGYHIEDELQESAYDSHLMKRLLSYVRPYSWWIAMAIVLLMVATAISTIMPILHMRAIDNYINNPERGRVQKELDQASAQGDTATAEQQREALRAEDRAGLTRLVVLVAWLVLAETFVRYLQMILVAFVGEKTMLEMRTGIFAHLQRLSLRFLDKNPVGRLMTRVTTDVENIQQTIVAGLVQVSSELFTILCILIVMLYVNWKLTLVALTVIPFIFLVSFIFRRVARQSYLEIRRKIAKVNSYMQEQVTGIKVVQIFNHEEASFRRYDTFNADHCNEWLRQVRNYAFYFPAVEFLSTLSIALIMLFGGHQILEGAPIMKGLGVVGVASIGMLNAYVQWAEKMFQPIRQLADKYNMLQAAMASSERVFKLLDTPIDIKEKPDAVKCPRIEGHIEFDNVWFAYEADGLDPMDEDDDRWVLRGVSFSVNPGDRIAIVGHTGAGKTTLASLLSRFYDVQRGAIRVDGIDVRDYDKTSLRTKVGVVLQDVFLFSGTIDDNIRLGNDDIAEEKVRSAAQYVNAARFIESLPGAYHYDIGERGCNLSTGQRQLLAFARTLTHDPDLLVLDEATSSIDTETEALIQDAITKLMDRRTSIVIAHRLSTVQHADRIIVMHHGKIRETGNHQELLAQRGLYYRLYQLQYKEQGV